ncbi:MAG: arylsulfatase [Rikenellaceae bacterium]
MKKSLLLLPVISSSIFSASADNNNKSRPNIIIILADDLGFGDVSANGSSTISTPGFDRIANEGLTLNNGYCASATSTPSRYALLTGENPWRVNALVLPGNAPLIINTQEMTLPKMLKEASYTTGAVGKWHLGLGAGNPDWNSHITPGLEEVGFDYSYIIAATNDRVPTVYVKNGNVDNLDPNDPIEVSYVKNFEGQPTGANNPELLKMHPSHGHNNSITNEIPRIGYMKGGESALWVDETMADVLLLEAKNFITDNQEAPFFLYYGLHQPHVPRVPNSRFVGKSGMGARGDAILEADYCVGELLNHLDSLGLADNTLIIFSSDNGPVYDDGYVDEAYELLGDHKPTGPYRGGKYSSYDAGTHVPLFVKWPNVIKAGKQSNAIFGQIDIITSLAALVGVDVELEDSENHLSVLLGKEKKGGRENLILEAPGNNLILRQGDWVYIPPMDKAGYSVDNIEGGRMNEAQLFNVKKDPGQQNNIAAKYPEKVEEMNKIIEQYK